MKRSKRFFMLILIGLLFNPLFAQDYQARMTNFVQVSEMEFRYDIQIRNISGTTWAYNSSQFQIDINAAMLNGGQFDGVYLTVDNSVSNLPAGQRLSDIDHFYSIPNTALATNSPSTAGGSELLLMSDDSWKTIARFVVKLRNAAGTGFLNFADVDLQFSFRFSDVIVFKVDYYMDGSIARRGTSPGNPGSTSIVPKTAGDLIIDAPDRQLAGYWFYQTNTWNVATNWNQVLKTATPAYTQVLPGATNNGVIIGAATVTDLREISQLTIADGGLLVLSGDLGLWGQLTVHDELFNDNQAALPKEGEVTIAGWDFEGIGVTLPYLADNGISSNLGIASLSTTAVNFQGFFGFIDHGIQGWARAPFATEWRSGIGAAAPRAWVAQFSTVGFENLKLSSKQYSDINNDFGHTSAGPNEFKLQWSLNGTNWTDIDSPYSVGNDGVIGNLSEVLLPSNLSNISSVYIRWVNNTTGLQGYSAIEDIIITGIELPSGILLQSTAAGTGSLLHNTTGVEATIKRYIPADPVENEPVHHLVSVPLAQEANPVSGLFLWSYLYLFDPETKDWVNLGAPTNTPLDVSRGYMIMKYPGITDWNVDTTYSFTGPMNNGSFTMNVFDQNGGTGHLNLVPNPFPSAIDWDAVNGWIKTNIDASIWIWNPYRNTYAAYVTGSGGINDCSNFVPIGQSFFIKSTALSPVLTVNNDARVHNEQFFFKDTKEVSNVLRIQAQANNYGDEILVTFKEEATTGYDGQHDASKLFSDEKAPQIFTVASDQEELSINALPYSHEEIVIPMGFKLKESGLCTFIAASIESFDPSVTIFLEDCIAKTMTDLRKQPEYSFIHTVGNDPLRFKLIFNGTTSIEESDASNVHLYFYDKTLYLNFSEYKAEMVYICIYSTNGQLVFDTHRQTVNSEIQVPNLTPGVYVVKLITDSQTVIKKVMSN